MSLKPLIAPQSIAVVGATSRPGSFGHYLCRNLRDSGFQGVLYPVNPTRRFVETVQTFPDMASLPEPVDLAILLIPAPVIPEVTRQAIKAGKVRSLLVLAGGFKESGPEGRAYEESLKQVVQDTHIPMVGPNCIGMINTDPEIRMHAVFANRPIPNKGRVAFISQSGALCISILDAARNRGIGFSKFFSIGNKADVDELDLLEYLGEDPQTQVILMYIEELSSGRRFIEITRHITTSTQKPILALKSGRSPQGARAARSHTGSLAGSDAAYDAILAQSGVLRVNTMNELFDYATSFESQALPKGPGIAVVTNSGGPAIIATDALVSAGLKVPEFSEKTCACLRTTLPSHAAIQNPCDLTGDADKDMYRQTLDMVLQDERVDGAIVILTPLSEEADAEIAQVIVEAAGSSSKTILSCFMGIDDTSKGVEILKQAHLPHFSFPEYAVRSLVQMLRFREIIEIPDDKKVLPQFEVNRRRVVELIDGHLSTSSSRLLNQYQADEIFKAYGLPTLHNCIAHSIQEVEDLFDQLTPPLAMKVMSADVIHKSDVGGVILGIDSQVAARKAFVQIKERVKHHLPEARIDGVMMEELARDGVEVIIGGHRDQSFGPMIMFGLGGRLVEIMKDVTFRLAPMWRVSAERMIRQIRGFKLFNGVRGAPPSDLEAAAECILRLAQLMSEHPQIQEFDINPLILYPSGQGAAVADGRMTLKKSDAI